MHLSKFVYGIVDVAQCLSTLSLFFWYQGNESLLNYFSLSYLLLFWHFIFQIFATHLFIMQLFTLSLQWLDVGTLTHYYCKLYINGYIYFILEKTRFKGIVIFASAKILNSRRQMATAKKLEMLTSTQEIHNSTHRKSSD